MTSTAIPAAAATPPPAPTNGQGVDEPSRESSEIALAPSVETIPRVALGGKLQFHKFQRITGIVGMLFLIFGLAVWRFKPHSDDRLALLLLVCAMFLAILHHYSMEENRRSNQRAAR